MKLFDFDIDRERQHFRDHGWIHARGAATPAFVDHIAQTVDERARARALAGRGLAGAKEQHLYDFPDEVDLDVSLFEPICAVFGFDPERVTLSERHLKMYDADAAPDPLPHKDRLASTVSLGVTVRAPAGTRAFLHPGHERAVNPFMDTHLLASLGPDHHPASALDPATAVELADQPGDVIAFEGSSIWHGRRQAAGAVLLYLKFNDFGADPLAEDPRHDARRQRSREAVAAATDPTIGLGPRFVGLARRAVAPSWDETTVAEVWDRGPLLLSAVEEQVLRCCAPARPLQAVIDEVGDEAAVRAAVERLADHDVVLLIG